MRNPFGMICSLLVYQFTSLPVYQFYTHTHTHTHTHTKESMQRAAEEQNTDAFA